MSEKELHEEMMILAYREAIKAIPRAEPNPCVGAILVDSESKEIVAQGYTQAFGGLHAERFAIEEARKQGVELSKTELYVTLEPCCHFGKTPPCTNIIIESNIKAVYISDLDPTEKMSGKSIEILQEAGIETKTISSERFAPYRYFTTGSFLKSVTKKLPLTLLKWAQTKSNFIGKRSAPSGRISSRETGELVHNLREVMRAVLVTPGTIITDKSRLSVRKSMPDLRIKEDNVFQAVLETSGQRVGQPMRLFLLPRFSSWSKQELYDFLLIQQKLRGRYYFFSSDIETEAILKKRALDYKPIENAYDLREVLKAIYSLGIYKVLIEAGPTFLEKWAHDPMVDAHLALQSHTVDFEEGLSFSLAQNMKAYSSDANLSIKLAEDQVLLFLRNRVF